MTSARRSLSFALSLALALLALPAHAADKAKILIGATLPLTGAEARVGGFFKEGYDLAFEEAEQGGRASCWPGRRCRCSSSCRTTRAPRRRR